jgi:hypothetical protein
MLLSSNHAEDGDLRSGHSRFAASEAPKFRGSSIRCIFLQSIMNVLLIVISHTLAKRPSQVLLVQRDGVVQQLRRQFPTHRSAIPFCQKA